MSFKNEFLDNITMKKEICEVNKLNDHLEVELIFKHEVQKECDNAEKDYYARLHEFNTCDKTFKLRKFVNDTLILRK